MLFDGIIIAGNCLSIHSVDIRRYCSFIGVIIVVFVDDKWQRTTENSVFWLIRCSTCAEWWWPVGKTTTTTTTNYCLLFVLLFIRRGRRKIHWWCRRKCQWWFVTWHYSAYRWHCWYSESDILMYCWWLFDRWWWWFIVDDDWWFGGDGIHWCSILRSHYHSFGIPFWWSHSVTKFPMTAVFCWWYLFSPSVVTVLLTLLLLNWW